MLRLVAAMFLAAALAGCSADTAEPQPSAAETITSSAPRIAALENESLVLVETPVHVEGNTAAGVCIAAGGGQILCHYELTEEAFGSMDAPGTPLRFHGRVEWSAVSPTSQQLSVYVPAYDNGEYHWEPGYPVATGPSPLEFDLNITILAGHGIGLILGNGAGAGIPTGYAVVQTPQDFVLDAVLVTAQE